MVIYEPINACESGGRAVQELAKRVALPVEAARILMNRGMKDAGEIAAFLSPGLGQLLDPLLLPDMAEAVELIRAAIERGEGIFLFGDYDVDGVCAVSILFEHIKALGGQVEYRVPDRREGYGLSIAAVEGIAQRAQLLITLDCGITALAEIERAQELGLKTIVTDHHQCLAQLPLGPVVNPHRPDSDYPFKQLCGTGVAMKVIQALSGAEALEPYLDRAALATVADIVPLMGENRVFAAEGLKRIERGACLGMRAMFAQSGMQESAVKASHLAFTIAPRINAAGRIGDAMRAIELLTTADEKTAKRLAAELDEENRQRQGIELAITNEALEMLKDVDLVYDRAIILSSPEWHPGVTGIVASRLTERYYKPVLLFHEEDEKLTASCRSIPSIHLFDALNRFSELFVRFGGHAQAAGLTLEKRNFEPFRRSFLEHMRTYDNELFLPAARYDAEMRIKDLDAKLVRALDRLAPFGFGNPAPVIRVKATAVSTRTMGADNTHLRFTLMQNGAQIPTVGFSMANRFMEFVDSPELDVLLCAEMDTYRGNDSVRSILRFARPDTLARTDALIARNEHVFFESFLRDARLSEACAPIAVTADAPKCMEELLRGDIQGALIIARTPSGAKSALKKLDELGVRERIELNFRTLTENDNAYNTLLIAPDLDAFSFQRFKRALVFDSYLTDRAAAKLAGECGALIESAQQGDCTELLHGIDTDRDVLGTYYRALRQIAAAAYDYPSFEALFNTMRRQISGANRKQLSFALIVFQELGFLRVARETGVKVLVGEETKRQLTDSASYLFILNANK